MKITPSLPALAFATLLSLSSPLGATPPQVLNFSGHLAGEAGAHTGEVALTLSLYDDPDSFATTHVLWTEVSTVFVSEGRFHVLLGGDEANPLPATAFEAATVYVGVRVGADDELRPRLRVASVPFALRASEAERLSGLSSSDFASAGHVHGFDALLGQVAPSQLPGVVVLDDELATALQAKADLGHAHDAAYVDEEQPSSISGAMVRDGSLTLVDLGDSACGDGQVAKWSATAGVWGCADDLDTVYGAGLGLTLTEGVLHLDEVVVAAWAKDACFDTDGELESALDGRYAFTDHLHDDRYPLASEVEAALAAKSDADHLHDDRYPLASGVEAALAVKSDATHLHDERYPLATDVGTALAGKAPLIHDHDATYVDEGQVAAITTAMLANGAVGFDKLADEGCAPGQVLAWNDGSGRWACADDREGLYTGADFALAGQACPFGQKATAVDAAGALECADDVAYGAGTALVLAAGKLNVDQGTVEGWARATCYDSAAELTTLLDPRYAPLSHTHPAYATTAELKGALATKADVFHDHADLYYLKEESDQAFVNEGQANAISGSMIADGTVALVDLSPSACNRGEIAKRALGSDGTTEIWKCAADSDTKYTAGTGLSLTSQRFDVVQGTIEGWAKGVAYNTEAELKAAAPAWDFVASDDLTKATVFGGQVTGTYTALALGNDVVTSAQITNATIAAVDLATGAVTSDAISNYTILDVDLADGAVGSNALAANAVTATHLADDAVTSAAILNGTIAAIDLAASAVTSAKIFDGTIAAADLAAGTLTDAQISATAAIAPSKIKGTAWTSANDGATSTLDADLLDGQSSAAFAPASHTHATYWVNASATLKLTPSVAAPIACAAVTAGTIAMTDNYTLCICGMPPSGWAWVTLDGLTACAW